MRGKVLTGFVCAWVAFWIGLEIGHIAEGDAVRAEAVREHHAHWDTLTRKFMWGAP